MTDLPSGWAEATLNDLLLRIEAGKSFRCEARPARPDEWGIIKVSAMTWGEFKETENKAVRPDIEIDPANEIKPGDILVSRANTEAYVGASVFVNECRPLLLLSDKSLRLVPSSYIDRRWFAHLLSSPHIRNEISRRATGTKDSMRNISQSSLKDIAVLVPPIAEQHRIVAALEDRLSQLDAASDIVSRNRARISKLHQAVLDYTIAGLAKESTRKLGDILREPLRNGHSARASTDGSGIRTLTLSAVTKGKFDDQYTKLTVAEPGRVSQLWLEPGDILVQRSNTPDLVGKSALYAGKRDWAIFPDLLIRVRVTDDFLPEYIQYILSSSRVRECMKASAKGLAGSMPKIGQSTIESVGVPVISKSIQRKFVEEVRLLQSGIARLGESVENAWKRQVSLRQAILSEAVAGRLAKQHSADEPASALLERIQAERGSQEPAGRPRQPKSEKAPQKETLL
ncbi:hypothetical protein [Actinomadura sp. 3N508]|uniref:hypothetical protein n=1 Tax=Actinomadura sp. 3N508 TaxID=3375153 RepID=UPI0037933942